MRRYSMLGCEEACWHRLLLAVPDPWGAAQRILCKKNGIKLAGQENTKEDRGKKGLERAPCLEGVKHTQVELYFTHFLKIFFLLGFGLWLRTSKVKVNVMEVFAALKEHALEPRSGLVHTK